MKMTIWLLAALLIVTNAAWAYVSLDRAVTRQHQSEEVERKERVSKLLTALLVELPRNATRAETFRLLEQRHPELVVKQRGDTLEVGEVLLEYRGDTLTRVTTM